jgi:hypothetical protein
MMGKGGVGVMLGRARGSTTVNRYVRRGGEEIHFM